MKRLRAGLAIAVGLLWTAALMPAQWLAVALGRPAAARLPILYYRLLRRLAGFRVETRGEVSRRRPTLFLSNHTSYWDIVVLGSLVPGSFIAKREVAAWPLVGQVAKLQQTVFVARRATSARSERDEIARRLAAGDHLVLFPEGTTSAGNRVLRFRSSLLSVVERAPAARSVTVQPVSIAYTHLNGLPLGRADRPLISWYGAMKLAGHAWWKVCGGPVRAVVIFHEPVAAERFASRKGLARYAEGRVAAGVAAALSGCEGRLGYEGARAGRPRPLPDPRPVAP